MPEGTYLTLQWDLKSVMLELQILPLITVLMLSVLPVCTTANIMLANNICDVEKDILVKRYTLPYYLGQKASLRLFAAIYYCTYLVVILMTAAGMLPLISLLFLITIIPVQKNMNEFFKMQEKSKTFVVSIKNYVIIMGTISLLVFLGGILG
jgi:1,4-dihydroxy-2-naphthoate octaprenyltransferase